jgi:hypothetical protein
MHFTDVHEDPAARLAARSLDRILRERYFERLRDFYATRSEYPSDWQAVTGGSQFLLHVSPDELRAIDEEVTAIFDRYRERISNPNLRAPDSLPVEVLLFAYPVRAPVA